MINLDSNKICYVFDVDGTLTEPRQRIDDKLANEFLLWSMSKQCYIATGSDFAKTKEQVPWDVLDCFEYTFCCMGNEVRDKMGTAVYKSEFIIPDSLDMDLRNFLEESKCPMKTGNHIEFRTGMINFSTVGRNADFEQRGTYSVWDQKNNERKKLVSYINKKYPNLEASVGGTISVDIIEKGRDKGQIVRHLSDAGATKIVFVGDRCLPGGNDHGFVRELEVSNLAFEWYNVEGPEDTIRLIRTNKVFDGGK
mgnify:CR=1 FL=1